MTLKTYLLKSEMITKYPSKIVSRPSLVGELHSYWGLNLKVSLSPSNAQDNKAGARKQFQIITREGQRGDSSSARLYSTIPT